ncbi:MAG: YlbF family regulator [Lachnospiraceae bacterium]|nr:YlbF family regulator [Lachnospiraceae bacterium]
MTGIDDSVERIVDYIKGSPEYVDFKNKRSVVASNPELKAKADRIRMENFELQQVTDESRLMDELDQFMERNEQDYAIVEIHDYIEAENVFCRLMQTIIDRVMGELDF